MVKTNIKFLNLNSEINELKEEIQKSFKKIIYTNTNFILGEELLIFEKNFSKYINTNYCIGVGNGTDALEIAINSLNLKKDDEIITQANTFISTCLGITNNKNKIKLIDINPDTYQLDLDLLEKSITPKTKVVLIVHLTGSCCNMDKLMNIINKHNLILIEDCISILPRKPKCSFIFNCSALSNKNLLSKPNPLYVIKTSGFSC